MLNMAYQPAPSVCSLPAIEPFMPLAGFPPARGYCSTTILLDKRTDHGAASPFTPREFKCPAIYSYVCDLLSELKGSDQEFARAVWYVRLDQSQRISIYTLSSCCIGVCPGSPPTVLLFSTADRSELTTLFIGSSHHLLDDT